MRIRFSLDFDGGAWPGPLIGLGREAVAGQAWLGPQGLLGHLETVLGLSGPQAAQAKRAAALVPTLRGREGFWSRSVSMDPLGSARELLRWRDELVMSGWLGQAGDMPGRVAQISRLEEAVRPGLPDRLREVAAASEHRWGEVEQLEVLEEFDQLPRLWQLTIRNLEVHGTRVEWLDLPFAAAPGDLGGARTRSFRPLGDGSLQLLRTDGPWAAAEEVAAWLAAQTDLTDTVVISPTPLLDSELRRFGLPTTGCTEARGGGALLEVLPLVIGVGWSPANPRQVVELLELLATPVRKSVGRRLLRALSEWPAVGSAAWHDAVREGLEQIEDDRDRVRVVERIEGIFRASADRHENRYPVGELRRRIALVQAWLRARREVAHASGTDEGRSWDEALGLCASFEQLLDLAGLDTWSEAEIHRFLGEARGQLVEEAVHPAGSGIARVEAPGAIAAPARRIVWWGFDRETAPRPTRLPFSRAERNALARAGIDLPEAARDAQHLGARWRRPLQQAREALLLVAPRTNEAGEESHPHPLWDEIRAAADREGRMGPEPLVVGRALSPPGHLAPRRMQRSLAPLPAAQRQWRVRAGSIAPRERESNTSAARLLECSFRWTLQYAANLHGNERVEADVSNLVLGRLAHALLEAVVPRAGGDEERARTGAATWFDERGPLHVAGLFLPGQEAQRERVRRILCDSAALFCRFVSGAGLEVVGAEQSLSAPGLGRDLFGIPDFVLGPRPCIVDAKWSGLRRRRASLRDGTASQLAFYAHLLREQPGGSRRTPSVAFFVLSEQSFLTTDPHLGGPAQHVPGPDPAQTWLALERAYARRWREVAEGRVTAPAIPDAEGVIHPDRNRVDEDGHLVLTPECRWCEYGGLCGQDFREVDR